jgi:hypothetical protein
MKKTLVFLAMLLTSCGDETSLFDISLCNVPCVVVDDETLFLREAEEITCNTGVYECHEDGTQECVGYALPSEEICDGIDNNCNGYVDELVPREYWDPLNTCSNAMGICHYSSQVCVNGQWICRMPQGHGPEVCDGLDNDCDGEIDNNVVFSTAPFGYDGPVETVNVGECRGWALKCVNGQERRVGQVLPQEEICGNGKDDDCDGFIDENDNNDVSDAFAIYIDVSGSMEQMPQIITAALLGWAVNPRFAGSKFAIIFVGERTNYDAEGNFTNLPFVSVISDFVDANNAALMLNAAMQGGSSLFGGWEFFPEAFLGAHKEGGDLQLSWPEDMKKHMIAFSDEPAQSIPEMFISQTVETWQNPLVVQDCIENDYDIGVFTVPYLLNSWEPLALPCGGWVDTMTYNQDEMIERLNFRFKGKC